MNTKKASKIAIIGLLLGTLFLSLVPVAQTLLKGKWQGVPPAYVDDDLYYYSRIKEVADGQPFLGNPYFIEYRDARSVAFFVADWLAAIPIIFGISFSLAIVFNLVFWSLLFVFLAYLLFRTVDIPPPLSVGLSLISYLEVYWMIFRPVAMQQVFPFFLLFLLAFLGWLRWPLQRRSIWFLIIASALSFYIYTYLWQIIFVTLGWVFLHMLWQKKWPEIKALIIVVLGTGLLALPAIIYTFYQIRSPFYWETVSRIALVESHFPVTDSYFYGRWAVLITLLYFVVWKGQKDETFLAEDNKVLIPAVIYSGLGLFIMTIANVFIGKDMATAQHIGRVITLWLPLFLPIPLWKLWVNRNKVWKWHWFKLSAIGLISLVCLGFMILNLKRALPFREIAATDSVSVQDYAEPLNWLEQREKQPIVIWADDAMSIYVPILTKHYVFWNYMGGSHLMPTQEVEDRFLASRIGIADIDDIYNSYETFDGSGARWRWVDELYKNRFSCLIGQACHSGQSFRDWIGESALTALYNRQIKLKKNLSAIIKEYHVAYLIADISKGEDQYFRSLPRVKEIWKNNRFIIYEI
jgi:hypothetical protein